MRILQGHRWSIRAVAFHPAEPTTLVSAGDDRVLRVWNLAAEECQERTGHTDGILKLLFTPQSHRLVSAGRDGLLLNWDLHLPPLPVNALPGSPRRILGLTYAANDGVLILQGQQQGFGQIWLDVWHPTSPELS